MMRILSFAFVFLIAPSAAFGHGLNVEARHRDGKLAVTVQFDDGTPVKNAIVTLPADQRGQTDEKGLVTLEIPGVGNHTLSVDAGDGHIAKVDITVPSKPWQEDQLFSLVAQRPLFQSRIIAILIGLFVIALVVFIAMKSMNPRQRQPS
jgi:hypothetical protein